MCMAFQQAQGWWADFPQKTIMKLENITTTMVITKAPVSMENTYILHVIKLSAVYSLRCNAALA